jgi:hypothetical protein
MSVGKDSISHESIADEKRQETPTTHPQSFTFQIASAKKIALAVSLPS